MTRSVDRYVVVTLAKNGSINHGQQRCCQPPDRHYSMHAFKQFELCSAYHAALRASGECGLAPMRHETELVDRQQAVVDKQAPDIAVEKH